MSTSESDEIGRIVEQLVQRVEQLEAENEQLRERVDENEQLHERVEQLEAENEQLRERVEQLEAQPEFEVVDDSDPIKSLRVEGAPIGRAIQSKASQVDIMDLEDRLESLNPTPDAHESVETALNNTKTPLEQIVALPEDIAADSLTANEQRARFIASDVRDYAQSVPAGWSIDSSSLRRVLRAADESSHTETVSRVMDFLDRLGNGSTKIVERNGTRRITFDDELVARLEQLDQSHDVVMGEPA